MEPTPSPEIATDCLPIELCGDLLVFGH